MSRRTSVADSEWRVRARQRLVLLPERGLLVLHEFAIGCDGILPEELDHLVASLLEDAGPLRFPIDRPLSHGLLDRVGQLPVDVAVDDLPLVVHDPVDPEVQIRAVELEELAEKSLELGQLRRRRTAFHRGVAVRRPLDVEGGDHRLPTPEGIGEAASHGRCGVSGHGRHGMEFGG